MLQDPHHPILRLEGISKFFGNFVALNRVSLEVRKGEVLAILGENGAGKSTLMKILSGLHQPDEGRIFINTTWFNDPKSEGGELKEIMLQNPRFAMKIGIGMVYQHFQLVEPLSVVENIMLGNEFHIKNTPLLDMKKAHEEIKKISELYGLKIDTKAIIEDLPVGLKQRVEILKQLFKDANLLILDEPTAVLTPIEVEELFKTIKRLKELGKAIIFISHKLKEPIAIADRIVVIRRGEYIGEVLPDKVKYEELAEMVVGKRVLQQVDRAKIGTHEPLISVQNLNMGDETLEKRILKDISFELKSGEILGVAGVQGNGQSELVHALMGLDKIESGDIHIFEDGKKENLLEKDTLHRLKMGIAYIPEDRNEEGLISQFQIKENIWLGFHDTSQEEQDHIGEEFGQPIEKASENEEINDILTHLRHTYNSLKLPLELINRITNYVMKQFDVRAGSTDDFMSSLSGGNQQKVLVGRELAKYPKIVIASQPTRGVDVGVMEKIHESLIDMRNNGVGILLVSSDLDEVLKLSDRIIVMYEGEIVASGDLQSLSVLEISKFMTKGKDQDQIKVDTDLKTVEMEGN